MKNRKQALMATVLACAATTAGAQSFSLEGAIIDSRSGNTLGVVTERGDLSALFRAQKAMTFGILRSAGISLEQLSPEVRARIERFQTTNVEAFRAFSQGLDLKDQGKFAEAREFFKRAADLDPNFALAAEQQQSMPDVNLLSSVQTRAVMAAAAGAAVDRAKATFVVDVARAQAALQAGLTVVVVPAPADPAQRVVETAYTSNNQGSAGQFLQTNQVVALSYAVTNSASLSFNPIIPNEWRSNDVQVNAGVLERAGSGTSSFQALRGSAAVANAGSVALSDGSVAYWGSWVSTPTASATVRDPNQTVAAPALGRVDFIVANAPTAMPGTGTAVFTPAGGLLNNVNGSVAVNFVNRSVTLQDLGFQIGSQTFSGLRGQSTFDSAIASGAFRGNYTAGACVGCVGFVAGASVYTGNFVGRDANGLVFSTLLQTGGSTSASGVHLFKGP